jgi:hypothetical protein
MSKEITIHLDEETLAQAERIATGQGRSLADLVAAQLQKVVAEHQTNLLDIDLSPFVKSLGGMVELPEDYDEKESYTKYLIEKYK